MTIFRNFWDFLVVSTGSWVYSTRVLYHVLNLLYFPLNTVWNLSYFHPKLLHFFIPDSIGSYFYFGFPQKRILRGSLYISLGTSLPTERNRRRYLLPEYISLIQKVPGHPCTASSPLYFLCICLQSHQHHRLAFPIISKGNCTILFPFFCIASETTSLILIFSWKHSNGRFTKQYFIRPISARLGNVNALLKWELGESCFHQENKKMPIKVSMELLC